MILVVCLLQTLFACKAGKGRAKVAVMIMMLLPNVAWLKVSRKDYYSSISCSLNLDTCGRTEKLTLDQIEATNGINCFPKQALFNSS